MIEHAVQAREEARIEAEALLWWVDEVVDVEGGPGDRVPPRIRDQIDTEAKTLVEFLESMHEGPLPHGLSDRARKWTAGAWTQALSVWAEHLRALIPPDSEG